MSMQKLYDGLLLYHGSYCEVKEPLLEKCAKQKDFGRGFYLTSSKAQAESFLRTSLIKAVNKGDASPDQNYGYISIFCVSDAEKLNCHIFEDADIDWLHCIAAHRKRDSFPKIESDMKQYDVIIGKIADDQTNLTLTAYIAGAFGIMGETETDNFCIKQLLPERLQNQYCFRTEKSLNSLHFTESEKIWIPGI